MILIYRDKATFDSVREETPFIGTCHIRGDFVRDEKGVPIKAELTKAPVVSAPCDKLGRYVQCHPWADESMAEFEAYWQEYFKDGRLTWGEGLPEDWEAMEEE